MVRKLKTFVTSRGFFDLAVAAPSMKAAMEAWGVKHNVFHQGLASETDDAGIVAAATAKPGMVLKRPVGTDEPFQEEAKLPAGFSLPIVRAPSPGKPKKATPKARQKKAPAAKEAEKKGERGAVISFEKARAARERARAREEKAARREAEKRSSAIEKAQAALDEARKDHQARRDKLERELNRRLEEEEARWEKERRKLEAALDRARKS